MHAVKSAGAQAGLSRHLNQERIVLFMTVLLFAAFALLLPKFLSAPNMLALLRSVAVLGILGVGMLLVVLGRGIDLSMVAIMAISVAWIARSSPVAAPMPMRAPPASCMTDLTSLKSTLMRPGVVMSSVMPWTPWSSTASRSPRNMT